MDTQKCSFPPRKDILLSAGPQCVLVGCHQDPGANRRGRWEANIGKDPPGGEVSLMAVSLVMRVHPEEV